MHCDESLLTSGLDRVQHSDMDQMNPTFDAPAAVPTAMKAYSSADAIACLRSAGVPVTHQRIEIARVLFSAPVHLSADQIWANVREHSPDVSRATVYNTLRLFSEKHLVRELFVDPQRIVYDSTTSPHFHLYNMDTGEVRDLADDELRILGTPRLPEGTMLQEIDVIVRVRNRQD
ncbi:Peroxide-responsive repressor PerR [Thauera sp. GDN1]|nr:Peroxide-responsive repressor PerR [Thauera sp. GDN1]